MYFSRLSIFYWFRVVSHEVSNLQVIVPSVSYQSTKDTETVSAGSLLGIWHYMEGDGGTPDLNSHLAPSATRLHLCYAHIT